MLLENCVFLDLETTGTDPVRDRITEIAVIETRGGETVSEWSSLIDPECPIPRRIQGLTGISDAMVAHQPRFAELAEGLLEALRGRLLVAHNARFDYGFLRNEFRRAGLGYRPRVLCTVKLSRSLNPEQRHHSLDRLIQRHGLSCDERHRALGDTRAMLALVRHLYRMHPSERVNEEIARLVKQHQPVFNRRLRRQNELCAIRWDPWDQFQRPPRITPAGQLAPQELAELFGVFRSRRQAREVLRKSCLSIPHRIRGYLSIIEHRDKGYAADDISNQRG